VPAANPLVLTAAENHDVPVEDDKARETVSQEALSEAVNVLLEFVLVAVNVWFGGLPAPATAANVRDVGFVVAAKQSEARPKQINAVTTRICQKPGPGELFLWWRGNRRVWSW